MQVEMMRTFRRMKDLSQRQLGERIGVSRTLISQVENGHINPYPSLKERIAEALGVSIKDIWGDDDA